MKVITLETAKELYVEVNPERSLDSLVLSEKVKPLINELVDEQKRAELLHAYNISPRNKILLTGPQGNGKTTLVEAIALELMCPLIVVRYESLIGSNNRETLLRIKVLVDHVRSQRCVLFFDDVEILEVLLQFNTLRRFLDELPDYVVIAAASNYSELNICWRFQLRIELLKPNHSRLVSFVRLIKSRCNLDFDIDNRILAQYLIGRGFSFAELEEFFLSIARSAILNKSINTKALFFQQLNHRFGEVLKKARTENEDN